MTAVDDLIARHRETLQGACDAIASREYWTAFRENPTDYPPADAAAGREAFDGLLNVAFELDQPATIEMVGGERSPYGFDLGITYPRPDLDRLLPAMTAAIPAWRDAGPWARAAVCLEVLERLNARSHEMANAVMHTTGQAYLMAFQAGGPHAQERGLEAVAYALAAMTRVPAEATWEKPQGRRPPLRMRKQFVAVPRGIALVIGCNTFPTWNGYPGLFASLVTGNAVLVKPSRRAVLPLAITVAVARQVLAETGFDPNLVCLVAEAPGERVAASLADRPEIRIVDYTGSGEFGRWLEDHARQAVVFTEKSGVNAVVIDSTDDYAGMLRNLAFSVSLYSGQMCTTPQNLLVPRDGISTDQGHRTLRDFGADLAQAIDGLLGDPARAAAVLGAIVNPGVLERLAAAPERGRVVRASGELVHPEHASATVRTPLLVEVDGADTPAYDQECFGPVTFIVGTDSTLDSLRIWQRTLAERGSLTASVYSTDEDVIAEAESVALEGGVALSVNLTGGVYVNQSAAFSDYHATGANPAANATFTDDSFVASRFRIVEMRRHLPSEA